LTGAELRLPCLGRIDAVIAEFVGACGHADAERLWKALQRVFRNTQRLKARVTDTDGKPGIPRIPPVHGRGDMRRQPAQEGAARFGIVDTKKDVRADIGGGPWPQDRGLDLVEFERRRARGSARADGFSNGHGRLRYAILSRNSSTAAPIFSSRRVSATERLGDGTSQASAVI